MMQQNALLFDTFRQARGLAPCGTERPMVCVQGLGFVGAAMALAVTQAKAANGEPLYNVVGVDLDHPEAQRRIDALNGGKFPFPSSDAALTAALEAAIRQKNFVATSDSEAFRFAFVAIVDVPLDLDSSVQPPSVRFEPFRKAIRTLGTYLPEGALVIVETTVPPGTCQHVVASELREASAKRGLPPDSILLAHSYERVMPGPEYLSSIINFWRVYAGVTEAAADRCESFLRSVINTKDYPLRRLSSTTASESGKLLENTYRAVNIALIDEWSRFAERVGIDLFEIVDAVRVRPTHSNIREPGFGVGGYCLTKDPLFADVGARELFGVSDLSFDFAKLSVATNEKMPLATLERIREHYRGKIAGKRMLVCGVSYRSDVGDTRYSPAETFARAASAAGATLSFQDPLVGYWDEMQTEVAAELPDPSGFDVVIFAVRHAEYRSLDVARWLGSSRPLVVDANGVFLAAQRQALAATGCPAISIGRGNLAHG